MLIFRRRAEPKNRQPRESRLQGKQFSRSDRKREPHRFPPVWLSLLKGSDMNRNTVIEGRDGAMKLFDAELRERAEPTIAFAALKAAADRKRAIKSSLSAEEVEWLSGVLAEGEAALSAVKSLLADVDQSSRLAETLKLKNQIRARRITKIGRAHV